jgi:hypothetical protein
MGLGDGRSSRGYEKLPRDGVGCSRTAGGGRLPLNLFLDPSSDLQPWTELYTENRSRAGSVPILAKGRWLFITLFFCRDKHCKTTEKSCAGMAAGCAGLWPLGSYFTARLQVGPSPSRRCAPSLISAPWPRTQWSHFSFNPSRVHRYHPFLSLSALLLSLFLLDLGACSACTAGRDAFSWQATAPSRSGAGWGDSGATRLRLLPEGLENYSPSLVEVPKEKKQQSTCLLTVKSSQMVLFVRSVAQVSPNNGPQTSIDMLSLSLS